MGTRCAAQIIPSAQDPGGTLRPEDSAAQLAEHSPEKQQAKAHPPTLIHQKLKPSTQVQSEDTFLSTHVSVRSFQKPYPNNRRTWLCPEQLSAPGKSEEREIHSLAEPGKLQKAKDQTTTDPAHPEDSSC